MADIRGDKKDRIEGDKDLSYRAEGMHAYTHTYIPAGERARQCPRRGINRGRQAKSLHDWEQQQDDKTEYYYEVIVAAYMCVPHWHCCGVHQASSWPWAPVVMLSSPPSHNAAAAAGGSAAPSQATTRVSAPRRVWKRRRECGVYQMQLWTQMKRAHGGGARARSRGRRII